MSNVPTSSVQLPDLSNWECVEYTDASMENEIQSVEDRGSSKSKSQFDWVTILFIIIAVIVAMSFLLMVKNSIGTSSS